MTNMHRCTFLVAAGLTAHAPTPVFRSPRPPSPLVQLTGNGEGTYAVVSGWGALPGGTRFGGTHGVVAQDKGGNIYVSTQSDTGDLVYSGDGRLLRKIAAAYERCIRSSLQLKAARNISAPQYRKELRKRTSFSERK